MLLRAIRSVLNQTCTDYHLIVVDDASSEDLSTSRELVEPDHTWLTLPRNQGPAAARNAGAAAHPQSEWITFLDSDDIWHPDKLEQQLTWHQEHEEYRISQVTEQWIRHGEPIHKPKHLVQPDGDLFSIAVDRCAIGPSCVMIRRDLWDETGGFRPDYRVCEDYELWLRICHREQIGLVSDQPLVDKHAGHDDQLSFTTPALDRWRLMALLQLHSENSAKLNQTQLNLVQQAIQRKATVLAKGASKRSNTEWAEQLAAIKPESYPATLHSLQKICRNS